MKQLHKVALLLFLSISITANEDQLKETIGISLNTNSQRKSDVQDSIKKMKEEIEDCGFEAYDITLNDHMNQIIENIENIAKNKIGLIKSIMLLDGNDEEAYAIDLSKLTVKDLQSKAKQSKADTIEEYAMIRYIYEDKEFLNSIHKEYAEFIEGYGNYNQKLFLEVMYQINGARKVIEEHESRTFASEEAKSSHKEYIQTELYKFFEYQYKECIEYKTQKFNGSLAFIKDISKQADAKYRTLSRDKTSILASKHIILEAMEGQSPVEKLDMLMNMYVERPKYQELGESESNYRKFLRKSLPSRIASPNWEEGFAQYYVIHKVIDSEYIESNDFIETSQALKRIQFKYDQAFEEYGATGVEYSYVGRMIGEEEWNKLVGNRSVLKVKVDPNSDFKNRRGEPVSELEFVFEKFKSIMQEYSEIGYPYRKQHPYRIFQSVGGYHDKFDVKKKYDEATAKGKFKKYSFVGGLYSEADEVMYKMKDEILEKRELSADILVKFLMIKELSGEEQVDEKRDITEIYSYPEEIKFMNQLPTQSIDQLNIINANLFSEYINLYSA